MKPFVTILGAVFLIAGLFTGLTDLSVAPDGTSANCGGAFDDAAHGDAYTLDRDSEFKARLVGGEQTHYSAACESKKSTYQILSLATGIIGVALLIGSFFVPSHKT